MATRTLNVAITGDARNLNRVLADTESRSKRSLGILGKGFAVAGAAAAGGLAIGLKKSAEAAIEAEKSQAKLTAQLRASGISFAQHRVEIDKAIQAHSKLSGFDDEDLTDSFTNIVRVTGDVDKSLRLTGLAADFARAKHIDVAKAGELVGKVAGGNTGILSRYGITLDKGASSSEALAVLQRKFAGQAAAYGKTTAGALDRAGVASENLGEIVGAKLTPLLAKGATALVELVDKAGKLAGPIREVSGTVGNFAKRVQAAFSGGSKDATGFAQSIRRNVARVIEFVRDLGQSIARIFKGSGDDFRTIGRAFIRVEKVAAEVVEAITKRTLPILKAAIEGIALVIRGVVKIVAGVLRGDFRHAWEGAKDIVRGNLKALGGIVKGLWGILRDAMVGLAKAMIRGLVAGLKGLAGAIKDAVVSGVKKGVSAASGAVSDLVGKINPFGDGIGRAAKNIAGDGLGFMGGSAGKSGAGLRGADFDLAPFARIGASMGLSVSSGIRPGSITSSGNTSYHSSGDAIDMADGTQGPSPAKMRFFKAMKAMFGSRLRELIYTPGGVGVKDGHPFQYTGAVAADHYDHVHVAYTGPFGDGPGRKARTGDGIGEAAAAARAAGFRGNDLLTAVAIAGPESRYRNSARLVTSQEDSRGMWQINTLAHPWARSLNLRSPTVAARAARRVWREAGGFGPWTAYSSGTYRSYMDDARRALSGGGGGSSGGGGGGGGAPAKSRPRTTLVGRAGKGAGSLQESKYVKGPDGFPVLRSSVVPFQSGPQKGRQPDDFYVDPPDTDIPTELDYLDRDAAMATLTGGTDDDIAAAKAIKAYWERRLADARATADPRDDTEAAGGLSAATAALTALTDAVNDQTRIEEQRAAVNEEILANQIKLLALAGQGDQIVGAVIAAVNGGIGGPTGLGFSTPGYPGGGVRY